MNWSPAVLRRLWLLLCAAVAIGCQSKTADKRNKNVPTGTLVGEVRMAAGARMPQFSSLDLVRKPLHPNALDRAPAECAAANEDARNAVTLTADGLLGGVVVAGSDFTRVYERKAKKHTVAIEHCRLRPSLIAAMGGDTLQIENHDAFGFEPLIGPAYLARSLPQGEKFQIPMVGAGIDSVQCSLAAPCGRTDLLVFFHPIFAVTDATGHFRIDHFPASELVRVSAWHPLFDISESFVWLDPGQKASVTLELRPKARFVPNAEATSGSAAQATAAGQGP
jgi:hypothetical protein